MAAEAAQAGPEMASLARLHSYANIGEAVTTHVRLHLTVDVEQKTLSGHAVLEMAVISAGTEFVYLDTCGLEVSDVEVNFASATWTLGPLHATEALGACLKVELPERHRGLGSQVAIRVHFRAKNPRGVDWLKPEQTRSKRCGFVYTQFQCILARTCFPCQDTPAVKAPYSISVRVPEPMFAVCSCPPSSLRQERSPDGTRTFHYAQPVPVPSYLIAFAAGDLALLELGPRTYAYCEDVPELKQRVAGVLAPMEDTLRGLEEITGVPYSWESYGVCLLPRSFPYGGMENPNLSFMNEALLDPELFDVVQHEMAHSWSGNLVTNRLWRDFWLNEGFTMYLERAIQGHTCDYRVSSMYALFGHGELQRDVDGLMEENPNWTKLRTNIEGEDPDDSFSRVPYEKGYQFLMYLESLVGGRYTFVSWMQAYFRDFQYQSIHAEDLRRHFGQFFPEVYPQVDWEGWFYGIGMPSFRLEDYLGEGAISDVEALAAEWRAQGGRRNASAQDVAWHCYKTMALLDSLRNDPTPMPREVIRAMDEAYGLSQTGNPEVGHKWILLCISKGAVAQISPGFLERFVASNGRSIYISNASCGVYPLLWRHAATTPDAAITKAQVLELMERHRDFYHPVVNAGLDRLRKTASATADPPKPLPGGAVPEVWKVVSDAEERARQVFDANVLRTDFGENRALARAAVFQQDFRSIPAGEEGIEFFGRLLNLGHSFQTLSRAYLRTGLAGLKGLDGPATFEASLLKHTSLIADAYYGFYAAWQQEARRVANPAKPGSSATKAGLPGTVSMPGPTGILTDVPLARHFIRQLRPVLRRLTAAKQELEELKPTETRARYVAYLGHLHACLAETRTERLEAAWRGLDDLGAQLSPTDAASVAEAAPAYAAFARCLDGRAGSRPPSPLPPALFPLPSAPYAPLPRHVPSSLGPDGPSRSVPHRDAAHLTRRPALPCWLWGGAAA